MTPCNGQAAPIPDDDTVWKLTRIDFICVLLGVLPYLRCYTLFQLVA
jgi:hypothetical protein